MSHCICSYHRYILILIRIYYLRKIKANTSFSFYTLNARIFSATKFVTLSRISNPKDNFFGNIFDKSTLK